MLKAIADGDYSVRIKEHVAGRIMAKPLSGNRVVWFWTITGPYVPLELLPSSGDADTVEQAKSEFRAKFDAWLVWAEQLQHPVLWNTGPYTS